MDQGGSVLRKSRSSSPIKTKDKTATPEWKKLLMSGGKSQAAQNDLFSPKPLGLESLFQQPPDTPVEKSSPAKSSFTFGQAIDSMPSSPPPWPKDHRGAQMSFRSMHLPSTDIGLDTVLEQQEEEDDPLNDSLIQDTLANDRSVLEQHKEDDSQGESMVGSSNGSEKPVPEALPQTSNSHAQRSSRPTEKVCWIAQMSSSSNQPSINSDKSDDQSIPRNSSAITGDNARYSKVETRTNVSARDASSSTTGGFSPVFISKHNTVDGRVDYTAVDTSNPPTVTGSRSQSDSSSTNQLPNLHHHSESQTGNSTTLPQLSPYVNFDRGGYSDQDSFKHLPLSPSASSSIVPSDSVSQIGVGARSRNPHLPSQPQQMSSHDDRHDATLTGNDSIGSNSRAKTPIEQRRFDSDVHADSAYTSAQQHAATSSTSSQEPEAESNSACIRNRHASASRTETSGDGSGTAPSVETVLHRSDAGTQVMNDINDVSEITARSPDVRPSTPQQLVVVKERVDQQHKRPNSTSTKGPTPKRIRTLCNLDVPDKVEHVSDTVKEQHRRMQAVIGKRKDARYEQDHVPCDPETLSRRDILRPRNPTPAEQRASLGLEPDEPFSEGFRSDSEVDHGSGKGHPSADFIKETVQGALEDCASHKPVSAQQQADAIRLATNIATIRLHTRRSSQANHRKPSVSTQDYVDEAMKIMDYIRARRQGELTSVAELADEDQEIEYDALEGRLTPESLSRPPSREGAISAWRSRDDRPINPQVVSKLARYQETGDESFLMDSILESMQDEVDDLDEQEDRESESNEHEETGENASPRIRIHAPRHSEEEPPASQSPVKTHSTHHSTDSNRTVQTNLSQRSRTVPNIAPEQISHLLDTEKFGMRFDTEKRTWVRVKKPRASLHVSSSTGTEDDPFMNIPDLSTNELEELEKARLAVEGLETNDPRISDDDLASHRPTDEAAPCVDQSGLDESDVSQGLPSSQLNLPQVKVPEQGQTVHHGESSEEELEHYDPEISAFPRPVAQVPNGTVRSKRREISPIPSSPRTAKSASHQELPLQASDDENDSLVDYEVEPDFNEIDEQSQYGVDDSIVAVRPRWQPASVQRAQQHRHHEISITKTKPDGRTMSLTLSMTTPLPTTRCTSRQIIPSSGLRSNIWQSMSPLSEFTIHQDDAQHLRSRHIIQGCEQQIVPFGVRMQVPVVVGDLVEKITDSQPDEPYWELMEDLELVSKGLQNLHMLDQFCPRLETLDVRNNELKHLDGAPSAIRRLSTLNNHLTSFTTWAHLNNLQHLDISGNEVDSLIGLKGLVHLRELKADNNCIRDVEGIFDLDGLQTLSLKQNGLQSLDFTSADLRSLRHLDVSQNALQHVDGLQYLPALEEVDFSNNLLKSFPRAAANVYSKDEGLLGLRSLRLAANVLEHVDVSSLQNLEFLDVDSNKLSSIVNISYLDRLQTLSMRSQLCSPNQKVTVAEAIPTFADVQHLYLSGNNLATLPSILSCRGSSFLSTRTLELALCGLQSLPAAFASVFPNLRTLNLNFNALRDLRPLHGLGKLRSLHLAGNRICRLRRTISVLGSLGSICEVDLRDNSLVQGFYPPSGFGTTGLDVASTATAAEARVNHARNAQTLQHTLPATPTGGPKDDALYLSRLDEDTRLRRRVYEILLAAKCPALQLLDGRDFKREDVIRDDAEWRRLVGLGVVEIMGRDD